MNKGFTLVELAIVLVIIGLLVGGVLAGQELIRQAQLRSVISVISDVNRGVATFKAKYGHDALPGDFSQAHQFGLDKDSSGNFNVASDDTGYDPEFDGNGNERLDLGSPVSPQSGDVLGEYYNFWIHLSNANLIKGSYSQPYGCNSPTYSNLPTKCFTEAGLTHPKAAIGHGIFAASQHNNSYPLKDGKLYYILGIDDGFNFQEHFEANLADPVEDLTPEEAFAFDSKLDNGNPSNGNVVVVTDVGGTDFSNQADNSNGDNCQSDSDDNLYNLNIDTKVCTLAIQSDF